MQLFDLHLGRTVVRDALTGFPVWSGATLTSRGYDLRGDLLEGGRQVRVPARSMLIQPGETQVREARCVEQGGSHTNIRTGRRAPFSVRAAQP